MRRIIPEEVEFSLTVEEETLIPVRGNAMHSDDEGMDREYEDRILERLEVGDIWAWASVTVRASWGGFEGDDSVSGCNYKDEKDFRVPDGYFGDLVAEAFGQLLKKVEEAGWEVEYVKEKIIAHGMRTA